MIRTAVGYSEQYYTIVNGSISDTLTYGNGGFPDWDNTPLKDQICYFNEKKMYILGISGILCRGRFSMGD